MSSDDALQLKLVTIGDSGVGKSWLLLRWATESDKFTKTHSMFTVGIDFKMKNVELDDKKVKIQVWDTAGQERFRTITTSYYRSSQGILLVYDITDVKSFQSIRSWISQILLHARHATCLDGCDVQYFDRYFCIGAFHSYHRCQCQAPARF